MLKHIEYLVQFKFPNEQHIKSGNTWHEIQNIYQKYFLTRVQNLILAYMSKIQNKSTKNSISKFKRSWEPYVNTNYKDTLLLLYHMIPVNIQLIWNLCNERRIVYREITNCIWIAIFNQSSFATQIPKDDSIEIFTLLQFVIGVHFHTTNQSKFNLYIAKIR